MSKPQISKSTKIHKLPFIIKKDAIKSAANCGMLFHRWPTTSKNIIKEEIIYRSKEGDFLLGKYPAMCLVNRLDVIKNCSSTVASYTGSNGDVIKLTSDAVVKTIGQANYDQVIASLCCVINQELKVKGILALLSDSRYTIDTPSKEVKNQSTVETQTIESSCNHFMREKERQRRSRNPRRSQIKSYIVPDPKLQTVPKKVVIHPGDCNKLNNIKVVFEETNTHIHPDSNTGNVQDSLTGPVTNTVDVEEQVHHTSILKTCGIISEEIRFKLEHIKQECEKEGADDKGDKSNANLDDCDPFPDLRQILDEDSNISNISVGNLSIGSISLPGIERNAKSILNIINQHTEFDDLDDQCEAQGTNLRIIMVDGSTVTVKGNPDPFHIATPDILKDLSLSDRKKLLLHQAYLDWKYCLQRDDDFNLPLHKAVHNNDVELLKRQCSVLKAKNESVDIPASGDLTALQLAIFQDFPECTAVLLDQGADIMVRDDEARTILHLAAEQGAKHVEAVVKHCMNNARRILQDNDDLWKPELENKTDEKLVHYLLIQLSTIYDNQGYTPLMLASKLGNDAAVRLLVCAAPSTINMAMPTSGNTALYLAAGAACTEALDRGDKTNIPENYKNTVEALVKHGADPSIENNSGSNVNMLLAEFHDISLSFLISTNLAAINGCGDKRYDHVMLVKDSEGVITVTDLNKSPTNQIPQHPKVYTNPKTIRSEGKIIKKNETKTSNKKGAVVKSAYKVTQTNTDTKNETREYKIKQMKNDDTVAKSECKIIQNSVENKFETITKPVSDDNTNLTVKPRVDVKTTDNVKPVILKNLPVVTKIESFGTEKPVLVKDISIKGGNDNGLLTQITIKSSPKNKSPANTFMSGSSTPKFLKILPKRELCKTPKFMKILPKPVPNIEIKKPAIILKNAIKRPIRDESNESPSSSSKKRKT